MLTLTEWFGIVVLVAVHVAAAVWYYQGMVRTEAEELQALRELMSEQSRAGGDPL